MPGSPTRGSRPYEYDRLSEGTWGNKILPRIGGWDSHGGPRDQALPIPGGKRERKRERSAERTHENVLENVTRNANKRERKREAREPVGIICYA